MAINYMGYVMGRRGQYIHVERDEIFKKFEKWADAMAWVEEQNKLADQPADQGEIKLCQK